MAHRFITSPMWSVCSHGIRTSDVITDQFSHILWMIPMMFRRLTSPTSHGSWWLRKKSAFAPHTTIAADDPQSTFRTLVSCNLHQSSRAGNGMILTVSLICKHCVSSTEGGKLRQKATPTSPPAPSYASSQSLTATTASPRPSMLSPISIPMAWPSCPRTNTARSSSPTRVPA